MLRANLMFEEMKELFAEMGIDISAELGSVYLWQHAYPEDYPYDLSKIAKEIADVLYVVYGTAAAFGIDIDKVYAQVHESNMSKVGPDGEVLRRSDGKVLKGPNYKAPDLDWVK
jgi:NTP pyrophosphatase (non-canonical NTP hydrolase)